MAVQRLSTDEIAARHAGTGEVAIPPPPYRHVRNMAEALPSLLEVLEAKGDRIMLGLPQLDVLTRGFGAKELIFFTGFAHSGKTQLVLNMIRNNLDKRILFFSLDDPAEMILTKLACLRMNMSGSELERAIRDGDELVKDELRQVAVDDLQNLVISDENLTLEAMTEAIVDVNRDAPIDLVVIDFLELIPSSDGDVRTISKMLKRWVKDNAFPTIVLHQGTRSNAKPGHPLTLLSMAFGGEQEGTIIIGTRRKKDNADLDNREREAHRDTLTLHVVKNKRPGGRVTSPQGIDFHFDAETGLIVPESEANRAYHRGLAQQTEILPSPQYVPPQWALAKDAT